MGLHFSSLKNDEQSPLHFWHFNYKLWWIFSYLQLLGDLVTDDDSSWATDVRATMKQRDRCKGRKESLGKETDALDPDKHFDVILLLCWGHRLRVMWGVWGHVALKIMWRAPEIFLQYVTSGDFVLSSCHYLISEISSISSLVDLNGWRRKRHGAFYNFFDVHVACQLCMTNCNIQLAQTKFGLSCFSFSTRPCFQPNIHFVQKVSLKQAAIEIRQSIPLIFTIGFFLAYNILGSMLRYAVLIFKCFV